MRKDLEDAYIPSCNDCQRNKSSTKKPAGPLHPTPVPDARFDSIAIDFIGPLPRDNGYDSVITITDRLGADYRMVPTTTDIDAKKFAQLFFDHWYCEHGLPSSIYSDRDKLFLSKFWKALTKITGVKLKMSTAYHPETDGSSERTNKTVNQAVRFHVTRNQVGWARALPRIRFNMMNTINASTGFTGFQLMTGQSPRIIPPIVMPSASTPDDETAIKDAVGILTTLDDDITAAKDNLLLAKVTQAHQANKHRSAENVYRVGDQVMLSTFHRRREYMQAHQNRVAKFMPRFDGPYTVTDAFPLRSVYSIDIPSSPDLYSKFHASLLKRFVPNDASLFPSRQMPEHPGTVVTENGEEWFVDRIVDERKRGRGYQYLVRWVGEGPETQVWLPRSELEDCEALDTWLKAVGRN